MKLKQFMEIGRMTESEYRALPEMNASTLVCGLKSMLHLRRAIDGEIIYDSPDITLGIAAHVLLLEPEQFNDRYCTAPDFHLDDANCTDKGIQSESKATKYVKRKLTEFRHNNAEKTILTQDEMLRCQNCIAAIRNREKLCESLSECQKEVVLFGNIFGVECKGRVDAHNRDILYDLKTTRDASPVQFGRRFASLHYAFKLAFYRELLRQNGCDCEVKVIAQETSGDFDNVLYHVPNIVLENEMQRIERVMTSYRQCLATGEWHGVDGGAEQMDIYIPQWALEDAGDELIWD